MSRLLRLDAQNRALRTFLQMLVVEVFLVIGPRLQDQLLDAEADWSWDWWMSIARLAMMSAAAYIMRRFVDPSVVPTPLPPTPQAPPVDPVVENPLDRMDTDPTDRGLGS